MGGAVDDPGRVAPTPALERVLRARYVALAAIAVASTVVAGGRGDWDVFVAAGRDLIERDGLHFYARHGDIQTGPLSLMVAHLASATPRNGFVFCVVASAALGITVLRLLETTAVSETLLLRGDGRIGATTLVGGAVLAFWWAKLGGYGHLDDALVLAAAIGTFSFVLRDRAIPAALLVGLAIGVKPWAVIFLPLTLMPSGPLPRRLKSALLAVGVGLIWWAPFILSVPTTVRSLRPTVKIADDSVLTLFGLHGDPPSWLRLMQLVGALAVGCAVMLLRGPSGAVWAAIAVRLGTDPGTWSYYTAGFIAGAMAWDFLVSRRAVPVATFCATLLLLPSWILGSASLRAGLRLTACVAALLLTLLYRRHDPCADPSPALNE